MGAAAMLGGEVLHFYHADHLAVLLTEERHSAGLFGFLHIGFDGVDRFCR